ncbi:MAG: topoisomerase DNA-binding C4 zinc finger domain-containing protein [Paludibacteraceae bacterium]|nr:topoisomerase DNA-binding C4 zinc finger domain-containing protein [Paludibacteraceae bacterium]
MLKINRPTYFWLQTWVLASVVQLATQDFCKRFLNLKNDPCGRQFDQMTQAARSGVANIAEGTSRHATSRETEMKLVDVSRASITELANDYLNWLMQQGQVPWSLKSQEYVEIAHIPLDKPGYKDDVLYQSSLHVLTQKRKFDTWLKSDDSILVARTLVVLCERLIMMLQKQIENNLELFTQEGGFTEALTAERLKQRTQNNIQEDSPFCPKCGKPMLKRMAKKGINSGKPFWSCSDYPNCTGTRKMELKDPPSS